MTECPSCRTAYEGQPRFCGTCGYQFASAPPISASGAAPSTPALKKCPDCAEDVRAEARKCRFCGFEFPPEETQPAEERRGPEQPELKTRWKGGGALAWGALALMVCALIWGGYKLDRPADSRTPRDSSVGTTPSESPTDARPGETVNVLRGVQSNGTEGFWPCGSTPEAFDELMKWAGRGDNDEVKRMLLTTHSIALTSGLRVKILDMGFGKRKVRVLGADDGHLDIGTTSGTIDRLVTSGAATTRQLQLLGLTITDLARVMGVPEDKASADFALIDQSTRREVLIAALKKSDDPRTGVECWVVSEALTH